MLFYKLTFGLDDMNVVAMDDPRSFGLDDFLTLPKLEKKVIQELSLVWSTAYLNQKDLTSNPN